MIYLVSNIHRSGSSMMMRCLEAGGLIPIYNKFFDNLNLFSLDNYIPNPNGFYQFNFKIDDNFYNKYNGKLIKCPIRDLLKLPIGEYKLVLIKRNPSEIRASMKKWKPYESWGMDETITYFYDLYLNVLVDELSKRNDMSTIVLNYSEIVSNPENEFNKLKNAGWDIDVEKASKMVDESLYRLRL